MGKVLQPQTEHCLIDLWEAWVDVQEDGQDQFTLLVVGDIYWKEKNVKPALLKRPGQSNNCSELQLEICPGHAWQSGVVREVRYSELLLKPQQYEKVSVFLGDQLLTVIDNIEHIR